MRRTRLSLVVIGALVILLALAATVSFKLYGEARRTTDAAAQWKSEALGWQSLAQRTSAHDATLTRQNRVLVRRYNHLVSATEARQHQLLQAVQRAQKAATAKEAAAAAAAAQAAASQPVAASASSAATSAPAAPAVQPAPAQAPAAAAS
ncbi:MAG: hypothetical protein ACR2J9_05400 [Gaiellales bacterium]